MRMVLVVIFGVFCSILPQPTPSGAGGSVAPITVQVVDPANGLIPHIGFYVLDDQGHLFTGITTGERGQVSVALPPGSYWLKPTEIPLESGIVPHLRAATQRGIPVAHTSGALRITILMQPDGTLLPQAPQFDPVGATAMAQIARPVPDAPPSARDVATPTRPGAPPQGMVVPTLVTLPASGALVPPPPARAPHGWTALLGIAGSMLLAGAVWVLTADRRMR